MSTLDEIRAFILEARSRCYRVITRENEKLSWGGRPWAFKIERMEAKIAQYDRWLAELESRQFADATEACREGASC